MIKTRKDVCATVNKNFITQSRILAHSIKEYNSDMEMGVFLAAKADKYLIFLDESLKLLDTNDSQ